MQNQKESLNITNGKNIGVVLLLIGGILVGSLVSPWLSMKFKWTTTSNLTAGTIRFKSNGLGLAIFEGDIFVKSRDGSTESIDTTFFASKLLPIQLAIGISIIGLTVVNLVMAASMLYKPITKLLPRQVKEIIENHWDTFVFGEGVTLLAFVSLFTAFYFRIPLNMALDTPSHYPGSFNDLLDLYKGTYSFFSWTLNTLNISNITRSRNLNPGLGIYLSFIAGLACIYLWFINFIKEKKQWPPVWQKRAMFLPLLMSLAFMPIGIKYSNTGASTMPLIAAPVLNHLGGILYTVLIGIFIFLVYRTATEEKKLDALTKKLYTIEGTLSEKEYDRIMTTMTRHRETASKYRKLLVPLLIGVFVLVTLILGDLVNLYMTFVGETPKSNWLAHTPYDWILLLSPLVNIFLFLMFRR